MKSQRKHPAAQIPVKDLCNAIDKKDRGFYDSLTEQQKKKFSGYLGLRYASIIQGSKDLQEYYLAAANLLANKKFFEIGSDHAKLQWLILTTISPGVGTHFHGWIPLPSNKNKQQKDRIRLLTKAYPNEKVEDLELYEQLMTDEEYKKLVEQFNE